MRNLDLCRMSLMPLSLSLLNGGSACSKFMDPIGAVQYVDIDTGYNASDLLHQKLYDGKCR